MRFTERNNHRLFNIGLLLCLFSSCLMSVACQTKEQKVTSALKQCQQFLDKDDLDAATKCYGEVVKASPDNAAEISKAGETAVFKKCVSYKEKKDYQKAIICFDGFTALEPKMANSYFQLADSYYQYYKEDAKANGRADSELLDKAEQAVKSGLNFKPDDATAFALEGEIFKEKRDYNNSLKSHKKAIKLDPKTGVFWIQLGDVQVLLMQDDEAIQSYKQAVDIDSNDTDALYFLGLQYERMNKLDDAIESYEKIIKLEPSDEEILQKLKYLKEQNQHPKNKPMLKSKTAGSP